MHLIFVSSDIVLPLITQHLDDRNITQGDYVKFICSFSYENDILDILWTVGSQNFLECDFAVQDLDRCFSLSTIDNPKTSTLPIQDTRSLPVGDHLVKCTAVSLSESFTPDPSYIPDMFEVRNDATLTILRGTSACTLSYSIMSTNACI